MAKLKFMPEAAFEYAKNMGWKLPKKLKSPDVLLEIVEGNVTEMVKDVPDPDRFECEICGKTVGEPDDFCWYCGADISDDETGGFVVKEPLFPSEEKKDDKKKDDKKKDDKKKDDKKPEAKKDDKKKAEPKKDDKKKDDPKKKTEPKLALVKSGKKGEAQVTKTLKEYTAEIRKLDSNTGSMAWKMGKFLLEVKETQVFTEGGYATMSEYVEAELEYSWQVARNFMRYAVIVTETQAGKLGTYKMELVARCPEEGREKLLKAALPKPDGQGMARKQLDEKLKKEQDKKKEAAGKKKTTSHRGRKSQPNKTTNLHSLIGTSLTIRMKEGEGSILIPDTACIIELNEQKKGIKITFFEAEIDEEE